MVQSLALQKRTILLYLVANLDNFNQNFASRVHVGTTSGLLFQTEQQVQRLRQLVLLGQLVGLGVNVIYWFFLVTDAAAEYFAFIRVEAFEATLIFGCEVGAYLSPR